ncbi:MAG: hypothetical protein Q7R82_02505 [Candidatus Daviesbacteria bacterium]|nr:hypothetical protein [Candidatus Daviesbacteria bacterium]
MKKKRKFDAVLFDVDGTVVTPIAALYGFHGKKLLETKPDFLVDDIEQIIPIVLGLKKSDF